MKKQSAKLSCLFAALLLLASFVAFAAETPIPPAPTRWVTDAAGFLSPQARQSLDDQLQNYERSSGRQVLVYIGQTTGDAPIEDWAVRAFEKWRVGRKGIDDGLILFIMARDRKIRVEVGYGLESEMPDAIASRIIRETIVPSLQAGDNDKAVTGAVSQIISVLSGGYAESVSPRGSPGEKGSRGDRQPQSIGFLQLVFMGFIGLIFLVLFITNPWLAMNLLIMILSGGRGGGGGGGGGGFRGGGGRSGGGGASGSW